MELEVRPHIMSEREKVVLHHIEPGTTIQKAIDKMEFIDPRVRELNLAVFIDGYQLEQALWVDTAFDPTSIKKIEIFAVLRGGGSGSGRNKQILALVAIIALAVASQGWSVALTSGSGALVGTGISAGMAQAGIMIVGQLVISAVFAPPRIRNNTASAQGDGQGASKAYTFGGQNNSIRPFQPLTRVYGRHRISPDIAANPYTVNVGESNFFYALYSFGYGPLKLEDFKIGTNPLTNYKDYWINIIENYTHPSQLIYYKSDVWQDGYSQKITKAAPANAVTRVDTEECVFDVYFPVGIGYVNDKGGTDQRIYKLIVEYSRAGPNPVWQRARLGLTSTGFSQRIYGELIARPITELQYTEAGSGGSYLPTIVRHQLPAGAITAGVRNWSGLVATFRTPAAPGTIITIGPYKVTITSSTSNSVTWAEPLPGEISGASDTGAIGFNYDGPVPGIGATDELGLWTFAMAKRGQIVASAGIRFPESGQWAIRVSNVEEDLPDDGRTLWERHFIALKSMKSVPPVIPEVPMTVVELVIKATGQLSGAVEQFSAVATSILPVWDGGAFVDQPTRNPAWIYLDLLSGRANRRRMAYDRIDIDKLKEWATYCNSPNNPVNGIFIEPIGTCDVIIDKAYTLWELLQSVASCGRASPTMRDNKYSVIIDSASRTPVQMFTARNSSNLTSNRTYSDKPHALRVKWIDPEKDYTLAELTVYNSGYDERSAVKFEELPTFGMTRKEQVLRYGRYMLAQGSLRLERFKFETDIESIVCVRGDLVHVAHDVIEVGGEANRIHAISTNRLTVTADMDLSLFDRFAQGTAMGIRIRKDDGLLTVVLNVVGIDNDLGTITLSVALGADVKVGDLFVYGERTAITGQYTIDKIVPNAEMGATVHLEEYAPLVYTAEAQGVFPPYVPQGGGMFNGPPPQNLQAKLVEFIQSNVDPRCVIVLTWAPPEGSDRQQPEHYRIWAIRADGSEEYEGKVESLRYRDADVSLFRFGGSVRIYRVRAFHPSYGLSNAAEVSIILPSRSLRPPNPPDVFTVTDMANGLRKYAWSYTDLPEGWAGVKIRFIAGTVPNPAFELMNDLQSGGAPLTSSGFETGLPTGQGPTTFSARTVDVNGTVSDRSRSVNVILSLSSLDGGGAVLPSNNSAPPSPSENFILDSGISLILVSVPGNTIQYVEGGGHAYTEVYGFIYKGGPLPDIAIAVRIGTFVGTAGNIAADPGVTYRIWLRNVARNGKTSIGYAGGINGKPIQTAVDPGRLLDLLTGRITESQLYQSLNSRLDLIDGNGVGSVNTRDRAFFDQLNTKITAESSIRTNSIDKISAQYAVRIDLNGYVIGYGLLAENVNGQLSSSFIVRADTFFVGAPGVGGRAPFIVRTVAEWINGTYVPAGVYIDEAFIANATITSAKIADASITNAKIGNLISSFGWDGTLDAGGNISGNGTSGWAIDKQGRAVFNAVNIRKHIDPDSGQQILGTAFSSYENTGALNGAAIFTDGSMFLYHPAYHGNVPFRQRIRRIYGDTPMPISYTLTVLTAGWLWVWGQYVSNGVEFAWFPIRGFYYPGTVLPSDANIYPRHATLTGMFSIEVGIGFRTNDTQYFKFGFSTQPLMNISDMAGYSIYVRSPQYPDPRVAILASNPVYGVDAGVLQSASFSASAGNL